MKKRIWFFAVFCAVLFLYVPCHVQAQQLTRFAVVDLPKVYMAFFKDSKPVRDFEDRSRRVQAEIDRMTKEIQDLKSKQADAVLQGDQNASLRLENDIYRKSEFLKEYHKLKTAELEDQKRKLSQSGGFLDQVYAEIRYIAESEGYTMVINLKENPGILWYSPSVDITDKLLQSLREKASR